MKHALFLRLLNLPLFAALAICVVMIVSATLKPRETAEAPLPNDVAVATDASVDTSDQTDPIESVDEPLEIQEEPTELVDTTDSTTELTDNEPHDDPVDSTSHSVSPVELANVNDEPDPPQDATDATQAVVVDDASDDAQSVPSEPTETTIEVPGESTVAVDDETTIEATTFEATQPISPIGVTEFADGALKMESWLAQETRSIDHKARSVSEWLDRVDLVRKREQDRRAKQQTELNGSGQEAPLSIEVVNSEGTHSTETVPTMSNDSSQSWVPPSESSTASDDVATAENIAQDSVDSTEVDSTEASESEFEFHVSEGEVYLTNGIGNPGVIFFLVDRQLRRLFPGQTTVFEHAATLRFDRGGGFGTAKEKLELGGHYQFSVDPTAGWTIKLVEPDAGATER